MEMDMIGLKNYAFILLLGCYFSLVRRSTSPKRASWYQNLLLLRDMAGERKLNSALRTNTRSALK